MIGEKGTLLNSGTTDLVSAMAPQEDTRRRRGRAHSRHRRVCSPQPTIHLHIRNHSWRSGAESRKIWPTPTLLSPTRDFLIASGEEGRGGRDIRPSPLVTADCSLVLPPLLGGTPNSGRVCLGGEEGNERKASPQSGRSPGCPVGRSTRRGFLVVRTSAICILNPYPVAFLGM